MPTETRLPFRSANDFIGESAGTTMWNGMWNMAKTVRMRDLSRPSLPSTACASPGPATATCTLPRSISATFSAAPPVRALASMPGTYLLRSGASEAKNRCAVPPDDEPAITRRVGAWAYASVASAPTSNTPRTACVRFFAAIEVLLRSIYRRIAVFKRAQRVGASRLLPSRRGITPNHQALQHPAALAHVVVRHRAMQE